jgi:hypothetical protein
MHIMDRQEEEAKVKPGYQDNLVPKGTKIKDFLRC